MAVFDSVVLIVREVGETETWKSAGAIITTSVTTAHLGVRDVDAGGCPVTFRT